MENIRQMTNKDLFMSHSYLTILAGHVVLSSAQKQTPSQKVRTGDYIFYLIICKKYSGHLWGMKEAVSRSLLYRRETPPFFTFIKNGRMSVFHFLMR